MAVNIWIIWTGSIADDCHAPAINQVAWVNLVAVLSRDSERWAKFLKKHNANEWTTHTSLTEFVNDVNINLVIICSPDRLHNEQAIACLEAGKHVLLEKPMTTNEEDAFKLQKIAEENRVLLTTGFHLRHHNGHKILKEKIQNWDIWNLKHIRIIWAFPQVDDSNWRAKQNLGKWWSLAAVWAHCIDLSRWFWNDMKDWKNFSATIANNLWNGPHDESALISAQLQSWPTVEIVSSIQFWPYTRIELFWDTGTAICNETLWRYGAGDIQINNQNIIFKTQSPFVNQLENIIDAIHEEWELTGKTLFWVRNVQDLLLAHDV